MREIKFRYTCKRDNGHTFSEVFSLEQIEAGDAKRWIEANFVGMFHLTRDEFTGCKDKNGVEIYEGDIVKAPAMYDGAVCVVEWEMNGWAIRDRNAYTGLTNYNDKFAPEVIGNIYENPELLEVQK